jgi:phage shock protein PspC (stress-responsive transcriptional regulator)
MNMHKLRRKKYGKEVAGVCAGLSDYYDLPVGNVRFAFAFLAIAGFGVAVYISLWILLPED